MDENTEVVSTEPTVSKLDGLMKDPEIVKELTSFVDSKVSKAVEAYKQKGFKSAVDEEVEKRLKARETKTPEQIRIEEVELKYNELQNRLNQEERQKMRLQNKDNAHKLFREKELPDSLLDFVVDENEEVTKQRLDVISKALEEWKVSIQQSVLKNNNVDVPGKTKTTTSDKEPGPDATQAEWLEYFKRNR